MTLQERESEARKEYLQRTDLLLKELCIIRMHQTVKYVSDYVKDSLTPIVHDTKSEEEIINQMNTILSEVKLKYNL